MIETMLMGKGYDPSVPLEGRLSKLGNGPVSRYSHVAAEIGGKIYYFGGITPSGLSNQLSVYDPVDNTWTNLNPVTKPPARRSVSHGVINGELYIYGGWNGSSLFYNDTWKYNPVTNTWTRLKDGPGIGAAAFGGVNGSDLFIFGGWNGQRVRTLYRYNAIDDSWTLISNSGPSPRNWSSVWVKNDSIYVYGGYYHPYIYNDLWRYDLQSNVWVQLKNGPSPRLMSMTVSSGNVLYLIGGNNSGGTLFTSGSFREQWRYLIDDDNWERMDDLPTTLAASAPVLIGDRFYLHGGLSGSTIMSDIWTYS